MGGRRWGGGGEWGRYKGGGREKMGGDGRGGCGGDKRERDLERAQKKAIKEIKDT